MFTFFKIIFIKILFIQILCFENVDYYFNRLSTLQIHTNSTEEGNWINTKVINSQQIYKLYLKQNFSEIAIPCQTLNQNQEDLIQCFQKQTCLNSCDQNQKCIWEQNPLKGYYYKNGIIIDENHQNITKIETICLDDPNQNNQYMGYIGITDRSDKNETNWMDLIYEKEQTKKHVFSICMNELKGGYFSIEGFNYEFHNNFTNEMVLSYQIQDGQYLVSVTNFEFQNINNQQGEANTQNVPNSIFDFSIKYVKVNKDIYEYLILNINLACINICAGKVKDAFNQTEFILDKQQYQNIDQFYSTFPIINVQFGPYSYVKWKPQQYLKQNLSNPNIFTFSFILNENKNDNYIYFGTSFLNQHDVLFDLNKQTIHLIESNCGNNNITLNQINKNTLKIKNAQNQQGFVKDFQSFNKILNEKEKIEKVITIGTFVVILVSIILFGIFLWFIFSNFFEKNDTQQQQENQNQRRNKLNYEIVVDQDSQLKSEEENSFGYQNDPVYKKGKNFIQI